MHKKIALCIGINEYAPRANAVPLEGCVNDALLWHNILKKNYSFKMRQPLLNRFASFKNIKKQIKRFLKDLNEGDLGVIFFSGHGTRNTRGGMCYEAIQTFDKCIEGNTHMRAWVDKYKHPKAKFVFIADSCHSGTFLELGRCCAKAIYCAHKKNESLTTPIDFTKIDTKKEFKEFVETKLFETDFNIDMNVIEDYIDVSDSLKEKLVDKITYLNNNPQELKEMLVAVYLNAKVKRIPPKNVCIADLTEEGSVFFETQNEYEIMIAACWSNQEAYETDFSGTKHGIFSKLTIDLLKNNNMTYNEFYTQVLQKFEGHKWSKLKQKPLLQGHNQFKNQLIFKN